MDILEINAIILSVKRDHMKHSIKYRRLVKKILTFINIPDVIYKFIINYVGSSPFPMDNYMKRTIHHPIHPHYVPKNTLISHPPTLEETTDPEQ